MKHIFDQIIQKYKLNKNVIIMKMKYLKLKTALQGNECISFLLTVQPNHKHFKLKPTWLKILSTQHKFSKEWRNGNCPFRELLSELKFPNKVLAVFQLPARGLLPTGGLLGHYSTTGLGGKTWSGDPNTNYLALPYLPVLPRKTNK